MIVPEWIKNITSEEAYIQGYYEGKNKGIQEANEYNEALSKIKDKKPPIPEFKYLT